MSGGSGVSATLSTSPETLLYVADLVHDAAGIPRRQVEKDFWVTEILRSVANYSQQKKASVVFKGGTSLSKAFGIIRRFSEDVDILVIPAIDSPAAALAREIRVFTEKAGQESTPRPESGFAASRAFDPVHVDAAKSAFEVSVLQGLLWPGAKQPKFEECCALVGE